ncbi:MAG: Crp/Fnr family transcriptional regulator [Clostridiales bacterium]|uniref:Crp/Fnr family transcriptional regulator n=1 Tax=Aminipila sp. TaxID=2060095 RepID=UPI001E06BF3D|nr:Crp/Fnr family transcriptional regulator [Aminipila sp.]MBE6035290.1 Crp/Fnr family transcriptional regulator [Clostridiales bacterium]
MEKRRYLCLMDIPIFSGMDKMAFSDICRNTKKQQVKKGEFLFRQGDPEDVIYYIKMGSFKLVRITEEGEEVIIQIVGAGETIGETALFREDTFSPISATAIEDAIVCSITRKSIEMLITDKHEIALQIIRNLSNRLYDTWERITVLNTQTIQEKVTGLFIELAQEYGEPCPDGTIIKLRLTQQEIASIVGASRVMVSHALQKLIKNDTIYRKQKYYVLRSKCIY